MEVFFTFLAVGCVHILSYLSSHLERKVYTGTYSKKLQRNRHIDPRKCSSNAE